MTITIKELQKQHHIPRIIIHSLDMSLYQAAAELDGREEMITDKQGRLLRAFSLLQMKSQFDGLPVAAMVLRHQSAYDEMINQPVRGVSNQLEVPLSIRSPDNIPLT
ncbi:MAG: hypothetical protein CMI02_13565 [Oceanospirillaceae bacterium]|nr:hypothetical protein [Oceanospirillaceae bacterium]MBT13050.1 hypothetical protein [Oceanospirillaceae bacterium]|tara:strand:+ start:32942 stop:33262 length:321 start_codon:yes stop_codon:yes gene_type:complete